MDKNVPGDDGARYQNTVRTGAQLTILIQNNPVLSL